MDAKTIFKKAYRALRRSAMQHRMGSAYTANLAARLTLAGINGGA